MAEGVPRFQTKTAYAAAMLRQAFAERKYSAGDRLQTAKLAAEFGLSLTPVREALFELASEGLVDLEPHRGARVADVPINDLNEVYFIRDLLESTATRLAAERATLQQVEALAKCHQQFVNAVEADDRESLRELSDEFHDLIFEAAQSPMLHRLIRNVSSSAPADTFHVVKGRAARSITDHEKILEAIRSRQGERAEAHMHAHVQGSLDLIRATKN